jgi:hypothetical protein
MWKQDYELRVGVQQESGLQRQPKMSLSIRGCSSHSQSASNGGKATFLYASKSFAASLRTPTCLRKAIISSAESCRERHKLAHHQKKLNKGEVSGSLPLSGDCELEMECESSTK